MNFPFVSLPRPRLVPLALMAAFPLIASVHAAGLDLAAMDRSARPGDDFYAFANGTWLARTTIPADRGYWGAGSALGEETNRRIADLIETAAKQTAPVAPFERTAVDFYSAYLDEAGIEARGLDPLRPELDRIAALADRTALARYFGAALRADVDPLNNTDFQTENLFGLWVAPDLENPANTVPYLLQGGLGLPDRAYFLTDSPHMQEVRAKYREHIATIFRLAGFSDPAGRADRVFALEHRIAETHATREDSEDVRKADNPWRREDFAARAPGLDWAQFFAAARIDGQPRIFVWHPGAVTGESALVASEPLESWRDFLAFHLLNRLSDVLPRAFADEHFAFYGTILAGTPQPQARWKRALDAANNAVGDAVGRMYVARYFSAASKARLEAMVARIVQAFDRRIEALAWMTPATKAQARAKLRTLYVGLGYPDTWEDYTSLRIERTDACGNQLRAEEFAYARALGRLGHPYDRKHWCMNAQLVNAVNMPLQNALNFPAAILQPPFFDPAASDAFNYGAIGSVIGHEISHSFDDQGSQFDAEGRLRDWWTADDLAHFQASSAALAAQYSSYRPFPDLAVNGRQTLSENLADLAGLAAAHDACVAGVRSAAGAGDFSRDQEFFLAFAQSWRVKMRDATLRQRLITDGHAPGTYRALTVRNLDAWYAAFGVQPGQSLYLAPADRVRVW